MAGRDVPSPLEQEGSVGMMAVGFHFVIAMGQGGPQVCPGGLTAAAEGSDSPGAVAPGAGASPGLVLAEMPSLAQGPCRAFYLPSEPLAPPPAPPPKARS